MPLRFAIGRTNQPLHILARSAWWSEASPPIRSFLLLFVYVLIGSPGTLTPQGPLQRKKSGAPPPRRSIPSRDYFTSRLADCDSKLLWKRTYSKAKSNTPSANSRTTSACVPSTTVSTTAPRRTSSPHRHSPPTHRSASRHRHPSRPARPDAPLPASTECLPHLHITKDCVVETYE